MTLDTKARATALRLVAKYGKSVTYISLSDGTYDTSMGAATPVETSYTIKAVIEPYKAHSDGFSSGVVREGDRKISFAASGLAFTPKAGDKITVDGESLAVLRTTPIYSGELVALYYVHGRK